VVPRGGGIARPAPRALTRLVITLPATAPFTPDVVSVGVALSADGRALVYVGGTGAQRRLYARRFDQIEVLPVAGTEGADSPFFSPDSQWVGFAAGREAQEGALGRSLGFSVRITFPLEPRAAAT
jgi:hypothetical protein